jgi:asparagine synthase (glutamine-hydrolysing)
LLQNYWGSYVAVLRDPVSAAYRIFRDPTSNLACYHATLERVHFFFSEMQDLTNHVRMPVSINWGYLTARMLNGFGFSRECALNEIEDIPGGESIEVRSDAVIRQALWRPDDFCTEDGLQDEHEATKVLRATVVDAVNALASEYDSILALLSGGLDSSVIASCLARSPSQPQVTCLNFYISSSDVPFEQRLPGVSSENLKKLRRLTGSADERKYARNVALQCGFQLLERERPVRQLNFSQLDLAPLAPRPSGYAFLLDQDDAECEYASATRAGACFTGQGGDSVFFATLRAIGAVDYAFLHPFGPHIIRELLSTVHLSRESFAHVIRKVIRYGYLRTSRPPPYDPMNRPHLLRDEAADGISTAYFNRTGVRSAPRLCPGKRDHIDGILDSVPQYHNIYHRERIAPSIHPFASQPVVETCLRIPTYVLLSGGVSRGLVRHAFRDMIPQEVFRRMTKGSGSWFYQQTVKHSMDNIRERLLGGRLVGGNLLDRDKVEAYLIDDQPFLTVQPAQILDYIACESWLTQVH